MGIVLSAGGTFAWTRHFNKQKKVKVSGSIFAVGLLAIIMTPKNVHGPGMLVVLTALCFWLLSIALAVTAVATRETSVNGVQGPG